MMRMLLQDALAVDPVLKAELLPKFHADLVAALADLQRDDLARLRSRGGGWSRVSFDSVCGGVCCEGAWRASVMWWCPTRRRGLA